MARPLEQMAELVASLRRASAARSAAAEAPLLIEGLYLGRAEERYNEEGSALASEAFDQVLDLRDGLGAEALSAYANDALDDAEVEYVCICDMVVELLERSGLGPDAVTYEQLMHLSLAALLCTLLQTTRASSLVVGGHVPFNEAVPQLTSAALSCASLQVVGPPCQQWRASLPAADACPLGTGFRWLQALREDGLTSLTMPPQALGSVEGSVLAALLVRCKQLTHLHLRQAALESGPTGPMAILTVLGGTRLVELDMSKNNLDAAAAELLASALTANHSLAKINLAENVLGGRFEGGWQAEDEEFVIDVSGIRALCEALRINSTLHSLDLSHNQLDGESGVLLAPALAGASTVTSLNLASNPLGDQTGAAIAHALASNVTLVYLDLCNTDLAEQTGQALVAALNTNTTLTALGIAGSAALALDSIASASVHGPGLLCAAPCR